ncbi:MAG: hypothetical protein ACRDJN_19005, partial [Chloroflexota bacterium]
MDISKLEQNEKTAAIASAALVVAGLIAAATYSIYGITWLAVLAALGMLFVVFQPQVASGVNLPGTKGSLMVALGGLAGVIMVLALVMTLRLVFLNFGLADIMFLVAVAAGVVMAWAGWQELQKEGGKWQLGRQTAETTAEAPAPPPAPAAAGTDADEEP